MFHTIEHDSVAYLVMIVIIVGWLVSVTHSK
jgi:hypothetical protein